LKKDKPLPSIGEGKRLFPYRKKKDEKKQKSVAGGMARKGGGRNAVLTDKKIPGHGERNNLACPEKKTRGMLRIKKNKKETWVKKDISFCL